MTVSHAASGAAPLLSVRGLAHSYGKREVLHDISFDLAEGEIFGLLGPNGSGKSTALAVLTGLVHRQAGALVFRGEELARPSRAFRRELGVVFQSPSVDPKLTARQNLRLTAWLRGLPRALGRERTESLLKAAGLADRGDDFVSTFSGGMQRRLDIARALVPDPSLLLMDEPTSGLDEAAFRETWRRLEDLRGDRKLSILIATHRPEEAERCDRVAIVARGRLATVDTPAALRARVGTDVVTLRARDAEALAAEVAERFSVRAVAVHDEVVIDCERGHELVPRLVEGLPDGRLEAVSLRHPTLADVFLEVTGASLHDGNAVEGGGAK